MDGRTDAGATENGDAVGARLRVVIAEDDTLLREGLAILLQRSGFEVVGQVGDAVNLLPLIRDKRLTWPSSTFACRRRIPPRGSSRTPDPP